MNDPDFERMSILVVDDSDLILSIVAGVLGTLGFKRVFTASDGVEAIEFMKRVQTAPTEAGTAQVDLIISDILMPRLDGHMLLRWLRVHPTSPDRFIAVMVISGAADLARVHLARDLGASEIVSKPFSAKHLADKLIHVINHPRQFVLAPGYFGPDRRRTRRPVKVERRRTTDDMIQIINAGDGTRRMRSDARIVYFRLRNRLRDKVSYGLEVPPFDPVILQKAQERIQAFAGDYADWVSESITRLRARMDALLEGRGDAAEHLERIHHMALEFGSQGGIFDYPLVTRLGKSLYALTLAPARRTGDRKYARLLKAHVDAIHAVIGRKVSGDGGRVGREILAVLKQAERKYGAPGLAPQAR